jgi:hypothetical protein
VTTSSSTSPTHRTLHLVDLENLLGDPRASADVALARFHEFLTVARWEPADHVIIATNPWMMAKIAFDLPRATSRHAVHGRDGADTMLLSLAPPELVVKRYERLVIGSGDGIFAARARVVRDHGVAVEVIARADGCSSRLHRFPCTYLVPCPADVVLAA